MSGPKLIHGLQRDLAGVECNGFTGITGLNYGVTVLMDILVSGRGWRTRYRGLEISKCSPIRNRKYTSLPRWFHGQLRAALPNEKMRKREVRGALSLPESPLLASSPTVIFWSRFDVRYQFPPEQQFCLRNASNLCPARNYGTPSG